MEKIQIISYPIEAILLRDKEDQHREIKIRIQIEVKKRIKCQKATLLFKCLKIRITNQLQKTNLFLK